MPVLSVTIALGAMALAKKDAIVTRLTAIEELASMDIICWDKTGTLTLNQLVIKKDLSLAANGYTEEDVLFYGALAAKPENGEPIDVCVFESYSKHDTIWKEYERIDYVPFDPVKKRTIASLRKISDNSTFRAVKGAPWVLLGMDKDVDGIRSMVEDHTHYLALRGFRSLGVAVSWDPADTPIENVSWELVGVVAMLDPPRHDTGGPFTEPANKASP